MMKHWLAILVPAIFAMVVGVLASDAICLLRLRAKHREIWTGLGEPRFFHQRPSSKWALLQFFYLGKFRQLDDPVLSTFAWAGMILEVVGVAATVILFVDVARSAVSNW